MHGTRWLKALDVCCFFLNLPAASCPSVQQSPQCKLMTLRADQLLTHTRLFLCHSAAFIENTSVGCHTSRQALLNRSSMLRDQRAHSSKPACSWTAHSAPCAAQNKLTHRHFEMFGIIIPCHVRSPERCEGTGGSTTDTGALCDHRREGTLAGSRCLQRCNHRIVTDSEDASSSCARSL